MEIFPLFLNTFPVKSTIPLEWVPSFLPHICPPLLHYLGSHGTFLSNSNYNVVGDLDLGHLNKTLQYDHGFQFFSISQTGRNECKPGEYNV